MSSSEQNPAEPTPPDVNTSSAEESKFYETLEQNGQLVAVGRDTDLSRLPPRVTHVRYPDGKVERIGFG